jgi:hypothetical protein
LDSGSESFPSSSSCCCEGFFFAGLLRDEFSRKPGSAKSRMCGGRPARLASLALPRIPEVRAGGSALVSPPLVRSRSRARTATSTGSSLLPSTISRRRLPGIGGAPWLREPFPGPDFRRRTTLEAMSDEIESNLDTCSALRIVSRSLLFLVPSARNSESVVFTVFKVQRKRPSSPEVNSFAVCVLVNVLRLLTGQASLGWQH